MNFRGFINRNRSNIVAVGMLALGAGLVFLAVNVGNTPQDTNISSLLTDSNSSGSCVFNYDDTSFSWPCDVSGLSTVVPPTPAATSTNTPVPSTATPTPTATPPDQCTVTIASDATTIKNKHNEYVCFEPRTNKVRIEGATDSIFDFSGAGVIVDAGILVKESSGVQINNLTIRISSEPRVQCIRADNLIDLSINNANFDGCWIGVLFVVWPDLGMNRQDSLGDFSITNSVMVNTKHEHLYINSSPHNPESDEPYIETILIENFTGINSGWDCGQFSGWQNLIIRNVECDGYGLDNVEQQHFGIIVNEPHAVGASCALIENVTMKRGGMDSVLVFPRLCVEIDNLESIDALRYGVHIFGSPDVTVSNSTFIGIGKECIRGDAKQHNNICEPRD